MARSDISWCEVGARIVIIDIARDIYLQLPQHLAEAFHALRRDGARGDGAAKRFGALARIGLCDADLRRPVEPTSVIVPDRDLPLLVMDARPHSALAKATALARIVAARLAVRALPLRVLVTWIRRVQAQPSTPSPPDAAAVATALFVQARQLAPGRGTCLPDSIALLHVLRAQDRMPHGARRSA